MVVAAKTLILLAVTTMKTAAVKTAVVKTAVVKTAVGMRIL